MIRWTDLLRSAPWVLGLAVLLATVSEAHEVRRRRSVSLGQVLSQGSCGVLLNIGMSLLSAGLLLAARAWPGRVIWGGMSLFYAGCPLWHWRKCLRQAEPPPSYQAARSSPTASEDIRNPGRLAAWRDRLGLVEALVVGFTAPILWFPDLRPGLTIGALLLLALIWLAVALVERSLWPCSAYDVALAVLLFMATVGAVVSAVPELTTPKATGLVLGVAVYRLVLRIARNPPSLRRCVYGMLALALAFAIVGLAFGEPTTKIPVLAEYRKQLPTFSQALPGTQLGRVSTNQVAGTLLYVLPMGLALVLIPRRREANDWSLSRGGWVATGVVTALLAAALLLTQSRGAWVGMSAGILWIIALNWRRGRWALLVILAAFAGWLLWVRPSFSALLSQIVPGPTGTFNSRIGVWARAISYIQDCPFTGYGLGSFRVVDTLFHGPDVTGATGIVTSSTGSMFDAGVPHAHNFALQTAYDLGVPGLVAYLALLFLALWMCGRIYRHGQGVPRALGIGCQSALIAYHVYGLTDVVAMGAKPGVLWWALLALIAALHRLVPLGERLDNKEPSLGRGSAQQP